MGVLMLVSISGYVAETLSDGRVWAQVSMILPVFRRPVEVDLK